MIRVALTGNVAAGKSLVAAVWAAEGVPVVSADDLAREAAAPGSSGLAEIREAFGAEALAADGSLDRGALRERIFRDDAARRRLEEILHPRIRALRDAWIEERRGEGVPLVVAEIPLLFETAGERDFDVTVLVDAPEEARLERLVQTRGISGSEARRIMAVQMPSAVKRARVDHVLENAGTKEDLERAASDLLASLRSRAGVGTIALDLHVHTFGSWDCLSDPHAVLERARARGVDRIAITDHNRLAVALRMAEEFPDRVIPGEEVKTAEGIDVIGLYLAHEIPEGTEARETIERVRDQGGIPYLPHPYAGGKGAGGKYAEELAPLVEVVEVFNARLHPGRLNAPAEDLARRHGRLRGGGSDAHTLRELGRARVSVPPHPNTPDGLRRALARGVVSGTTAPHAVHLASTWAKVRKRLPGGAWPNA